MKWKLKSGRSKDRTFSLNLAEIRIPLAVFNAVFIFLALGINAARMDYLIAGVYLALNLICWLFPFFRQLAVRSLRFFLFGVDLVVTMYMMVISGGLTSELYPFLFIPVLVAVLRFKLPGVLCWCSIVSAVLIVSAFYSDTFSYVGLAIKVGYLFLAGVAGGYLFQRTYSVRDEISKTLTRWNINLQRLNSFSQEVTGSSDLEAIFAQIFKTVRQTNAAQMVAIMIFDDEYLKLYDSIGWDESWVVEYNMHPLTKHSLSLAPIIVFKEPLICKNINKHPELTKIFEGIPIRSLFAFPLVVTGEVVGMLIICGRESEQLVMSDQETQILSSIASQAGIAIQNVVSFNQEKRKADTDGLTGLYNRRYFNEQIEWLSARAEHQGLPLSLIMLDVDNFKKYNDSYGHPEGDHLLKTMTAYISEVVRDEDIFARYGGEEFAIILKDTSNRVAMYIAERIRQVVAEIPEGTLKCPITVSVGVGTLPDFANDRGSLLDFTDKSLYHAKHNGKNRVSCGYE